MAEQRPDNIIKNPRRFHLSFAMVVFAFAIMFFVIHGILLLTRTRVIAYNIGRAESDNVTGTFTGMILREENSVTADRDGYVSYYAVQGERMSRDSLVCIVDESGSMEEKLHKMYYGQGVLSDDSRLKIQTAVDDARESYDRSDFRTAAVAKANIKGTVFGRLMADAGSDVLEGLSPEEYTAMYSEESGFILLYSDGYENASVSDLTAADLSGKASDTVERVAGDAVKKGEFVYKVAPENAFTMVFSLSEADAADLTGRKSLTVRMEDGLEITGSFSMETLKDGTAAGVLTFRKYGGNYLANRYESFQILDKSVTGYKIPETSIVTKSFYVVEEKYITQGAASNRNGVMVMRKDGAVFLEATVYRRSGIEGADFIIGEDYAYIWSEDLKAGDTILIDEQDPETGKTERSTMTLGVMASVEGVYQINSGYCVFKPIVRIANSLETSYVVVSSRVRGGLSAYDRIVMDASIVRENQIIFE